MAFLDYPRCRLFVVLVLVAAVAGCGGNAAFVGERLDPLTSVTIRYSEPPLVFYRDVPGRAAFSRDYVYLAPVEINRSGDYRYFLWLGIWNVDSDVSTPESRDGFDYITILADGEPLRLELRGWTPDAIGASEPLFTKPAVTADAYYEVSLDQLRRVAGASDLRVETGGADREAYEPWDDQRPGKAAFHEFVTGPNY